MIFRKAVLIALAVAVALFTLGPTSAPQLVGSEPGIAQAAKKKKGKCLKYKKVKGKRTKKCLKRAKVKKAKPKKKQPAPSYDRTDDRREAETPDREPTPTPEPDPTPEPVPEPEAADPIEDEEADWADPTDLDEDGDPTGVDGCQEEVEINGQDYCVIS
jgi:hypothetical protein